MLPRTPYGFAAEDIDRAARELTGIGRGEPRSAASRPLPAQHGRRWAARIVEELLTSPQSPAVHAPVGRDMIDLVAATVVSVFPNTALSRGYVPGPGHARPSPVRRAVAFIAARWGLRRLDRFTAGYQSTYRHPPLHTWNG